MRKSLGHALAGLRHAVSLERNLQLFLLGFGLLLLLGAIVGLLTWEWLALILAGGLFLATELLNTALERISDVLDDERKLLGRREFHQGVRDTKDVAASASLVSLIIVGIVTILIFAPYVALYSPF